jgi:hypothetical protein
MSVLSSLLVQTGKTSRPPKNYAHIFATLEETLERHSRRIASDVGLVLFA